MVQHEASGVGAARGSQLEGRGIGSRCPQHKDIVVTRALSSGRGRNPRFRLSRGIPLVPVEGKVAEWLLQIQRDAEVARPNLLRWTGSSCHCAGQSHPDISPRGDAAGGPNPRWFSSKSEQGGGAEQQAEGLPGLCPCVHPGDGPVRPPEGSRAPAVPAPTGTARSGAGGVGRGEKTEKREKSRKKKNEKKRKKEKR